MACNQAIVTIQKVIAHKAESFGVFGEPGKSAEWDLKFTVAGQAARQRFDGVRDGTVLTVNRQFLIDLNAVQESLFVEVSGVEIDDSSANDELPTATGIVTPKTNWTEGQTFRIAAPSHDDFAYDFVFDIRCATQLISAGSTIGVAAWSGWQALDGSFAVGVNPAAVSRKPGLIELFCRGLDNSIWQNFRHPDTGSWNGWFQIPDPGFLTGDLAVISMSPDSLQLFGVGGDGQMCSKWWTDANGWSGWQALGGSFAAGVNPAAVSRKPGLIELFCRGLDNSIWQNFRHPSTGEWSGWFQIPDPGDLIGDLAVVSMSPNSFQLFGIGTDTQMWSKWWVH